MNERQKKQLRQELASVGASSSEVTYLVGLADSLKVLKTKNIKQAPFSQRLSGWAYHRVRTLTTIGLSSFAGAVLGVFVVVFSQTAIPGNLLFPIQQLSDDVAVSISSSYRGVVMMKRAQQVKQLVRDKASSSLILATLAEYQSEATIYKSRPSDYAVFEYCKTNLQQAALMAKGSERQAINNTLVSLKNA